MQWFLELESQIDARLRLITFDRFRLLPINDILGSDDRLPVVCRCKATAFARTRRRGPSESQAAIVSLKRCSDPRRRPTERRRWRITDRVTKTPDRVPRQVSEGVQVGSLRLVDHGLEPDPELWRST